MNKFNINTKKIIYVEGNQTSFSDDSNFVLLPERLKHEYKISYKNVLKSQFNKGVSREYYCIKNIEFNNGSNIKKIDGNSFLIDMRTFQYGHLFLNYLFEYEYIKKEIPDLKLYILFYNKEYIDYYLKNNKIWKDLIHIYNISLNDIFSVKEDSLIFENLYYVSLFEGSNLFYNLNLPTQDIQDKDIDFYVFSAKLLVERFKSFFKKTKYKKIYLSRKKHTIDNKMSSSYIRSYPEDWENEIEIFLKQKGYDIIYQEDYSLIDQISICNNADEIVAFDGTNILNLIFAKQNAVFYLLNIDDSWRHIFPDLVQKTSGINMIDLAEFNYKNQKTDYKQIISKLNIFLNKNVNDIERDIS